MLLANSMNLTGRNRHKLVEANDLAMRLFMNTGYN